MIIDLRSDTVTKPTKQMVEAMKLAVVGDDVFGEDNTVKALEAKLATMFGKEKGLFCPSGTMANQIAVKVHTNPLDEVILHKLSHIYYYEGGGVMFNSAVSVNLLEGKRGIISAQDVENAINPNDIHRPRTSLVTIENTMNKGGGAVYSTENITQISEVCKKYNLKFHLDGARIFNALAVSKQSTRECGSNFDSISVCLSKGLGAPIGSVLLGSSEFISKAVRIRKVLGGGMRQVGYIAAAGLYAINNHINRLVDDHKRAKILKNELEKLSWVESIMPVETNIIIFKVAQNLSSSNICSKLERHNLLAMPFDSKSIRFVTHIDFSDEMIEEAVNILHKV